MHEAISWGRCSIFVNHTVIQSPSVFSGNFLHEEWVTCWIKSSGHCSIFFIARCTWKPYDKKDNKCMYCEMSAGTDWPPGSPQTPTLLEKRRRPGNQYQQAKLVYLCQRRITNRELFAHCMCRNTMSTRPCCNRKQKIRLGEQSALPERQPLTVFLFMFCFTKLRLPIQMIFFSPSFISQTALSYC